MNKTQKRILCVEDHGDTCELIAMILPDYKIISTHTKADALRLASSEHFDLFLLDYHLPDGTGLDVCLFIRAFDHKTPILFSTAFDLLTEAEAVKLGAQGVIRKGLTFTEGLQEQVTRHLIDHDPPNLKTQQ